MEAPILSFFSPDMVFQFDLGGYTSLRWRPMYDKPGEFELHTSPIYFDLVRTGQIVLRDDHPKESVIVEGREIESGDLIIRGRFLSAMLEDAAIRPIYNFNGTIEEAMRRLVSEQYGRVARTLPMKLAPAVGFSQKIEAQVSLKNLGTVLQAMARAGGLGYRVWADPTEQCLYFEIYAGTDRTEGQEDNPRAIFADTYYNIDRPVYTENEANYKNYAIVCGAGEGTARIIVDVDRTNGEDRRELLVDARDLQQEGQTDAQYRAALAQRGREKLDECARVRAFEVGIKSSSQFKYKVDWDLGDIVTGQQTQWGISLNQRVSEVEEIYENDSVTITPTLGNPAPETFNLEEGI